MKKETTLFYSRDKFLSNRSISKLANFVNSAWQPPTETPHLPTASSCQQSRSHYIRFLRHKENNWFALPVGEIECTKISVHFLQFALWFQNARFHWTLIRPSKENCFSTPSFPRLAQRDRCLPALLNSIRLARNLRLGLSGAGFAFPEVTGTAF